MMVLCCLPCLVYHCLTKVRCSNLDFRRIKRKIGTCAYCKFKHIALRMAYKILPPALLFGIFSFFVILGGLSVKNIYQALFIHLSLISSFHN
ncbi:hypothetical protein D3C86_1742090 [compost metagenome]